MQRPNPKPNMSSSSLQSPRLYGKNSKWLRWLWSRLWQKYENVLREPDAYLHQRDVAIGERNEFQRQRDIALGERNEYLRQLDEAKAKLAKQTPAFIRDEVIEVAVLERDRAKSEAASLRVRCSRLMADLERLTREQE